MPPPYGSPDIPVVVFLFKGKPQEPIGCVTMTSGRSQERGLAVACMSHTCCQAKTGNDVSERQLLRMRIALTVLATLAELANLTREHFTGGVVSHHVLDRSDLPAISNWWGALLVPALTWFLLGRTQRRIARRTDAGQAASRLPLTVVVGFVADAFRHPHLHLFHAWL